MFTDAISGVKVSGPTAVLLAGNSTANISCQATGGDVMTTVWLKDGKPLSAGGRLVFAKDMSSVMIKLLQKEDNGEYTCQLSNPVSKEQASYKMEVNCECLFGGDACQVLQHVYLFVPGVIYCLRTFITRPHSEIHKNIFRLN